MAVDKYQSGVYNLQIFINYHNIIVEMYKVYWYDYPLPTDKTDHSFDQIQFLFMYYKYLLWNISRTLLTIKI